MQQNSWHNIKHKEDSLNSNLHVQLDATQWSVPGGIKCVKISPSSTAAYIMVERTKTGNAQVKPTTIYRLLEDLST